MYEHVCAMVHHPFQYLLEIPGWYWNIAPIHSAKTTELTERELKETKGRRYLSVIRRRELHHEYMVLPLLCRKTGRPHLYLRRGVNQSESMAKGWENFDFYVASYPCPSFRVRVLICDRPSEARAWGTALHPVRAPWNQVQSSCASGFKIEYSKHFRFWSERSKILYFWLFLVVSNSRSFKGVAPRL